MIIPITLSKAHVVDSGLDRLKPLVQVHMIAFTYYLWASKARRVIVSCRWPDCRMQHIEYSVSPSSSASSEPCLAGVGNSGYDFSHFTWLMSLS